MIGNIHLEYLGDLQKRKSHQISETKKEGIVIDRGNVINKGRKPGN